MHKTIPMVGRISITTFASLVRAYEKEGYHIKSKSDVLWRAVEQLSALYERKHGIEAFTSITDALEYLDFAGLSLGTNSRVQKAVLQAKADESYFMEYGEDVPTHTTKKQLSQMSSSEMRAAAEKIARALIPDKVESARTPAEQAEIDAEKLSRQRDAIRQMMGDTKHETTSDSDPSISNHGDNAG